MISRSIKVIITAGYLIAGIVIGILPNIGRAENEASAAEDLTPAPAANVEAPAAATTSPSPTTSAATPTSTPKIEQSMDSMVQIVVAASFEPKEAVGLLLSSHGVAEKPALKLDKIRDGLFLVSFGYLKGEVRKDTFASAMVLSVLGETAFGDIRSLSGITKTDSFHSLPQCPPDKSLQSVDPARFGAYERLMSMRLERREIYRKEITEIMRGSFLENIRKLEKGFGLSRGRQLSAELTPVELIDRLSRLVPAIHDLTEREKKDDSKQGDDATTP